MKHRTVKSYAMKLLTEVSYVDVYHRNVGLDYQQILRMLKDEFPASATTLKELQKTAYSMNANTRLPVRRRSRKILAHDFARSLLIESPGLTYQAISRRVKRAFPDTPTLSISQLQSAAGSLARAGMKLPARPGES